MFLKARIGLRIPTIERFPLKFKGKYTIAPTIHASDVDGTGIVGRDRTLESWSYTTSRNMRTEGGTFLKTYLCCAANVTMTYMRGE